MAGTLTISTLSDGTNSTSATNVVQGSAKAWVNFNGTSGAIRSSYNVSSLTVNGTGDYTANFTNALPNANYSSIASCSASFGVASVFVSIDTGASATEYAPTTSAFRFYTGAYNGTAYNVKYVSLAIFD